MKEQGEKNRMRYRVDIKVIKNLINDLILLKDASVQSKNLEFDFVNNSNFDSEKSISKLEKEYCDAVPEVKQKICKYIERGKISKKYKQIALILYTV